MKNPNCHKCVYRKSIPGDAHLECSHPSIENNSLRILLDLMGSKNNVSITDLNIKFNPYGIRMGWFNWPMNFDPTWLENCEGYKEKLIINKE